ncbi:serine carboxypeptidase [Pisolithus croceorrhizus]|nr:serine carboxypeptidase [Pisolithus croceorrhizus]
MVQGSHRQTAFRAILFTHRASQLFSSSFIPVGRPDTLSVEQFTTLGHPAFPAYSVRIKRADPTAFTCDPTVKHLFFYLFENRNDPAKDDVTFSTNGGPGCSSSLGLFMELGPCRVLSDGGPLFSPFSRNSNASVFFVDQPIGVGFSYADYDEIVKTRLSSHVHSTTEEAAKDIAAFVAVFFQNFPEFQNRGFHMAGGRYLPVFASEVYDQNARLVEVGITPVNLTSIVIGMNPYCISKKCEDKPEDLCYPVTRYAVCLYIKEYLDNPEIRAAINVSSSIGKFNCCSDDVSAAFTSMMDENHPSDSYVAELLEREVRVLVYVGTSLRCDVAGRTRSAAGFTYATVNEAGHKVPYDKPEEALEMVKRWLAGETL